MLEPLVDSVARYLIPVFFGGVFMLYIVVRGVVDVVQSVSRERTRREIAAYVSQGGMTPEQGERLLAAKEPRSGA